MESSIASTHREHLQKLFPFCQALDRVLKDAAGGESSVIWRDAVAARCVECDIEISGEELHALSQPPSAEHSNAKIGRLRRGDCARVGCNSYFCVLSFRSYGDLNWTEILEKVDREQKPLTQRGKARVAFWSFLSLSLARRIAVLCFSILLLLLIRQWYIGGRIPLVREPERFAVDPASTGSSPVP